MDKYCLLDQGDLVEHITRDNELGIVVKIYPFRTHYDHRIMVEWNVDGVRCLTNVHLLRKVSR